MRSSTSVSRVPTGCPRGRSASTPNYAPTSKPCSRKPRNRESTTLPTRHRSSTRMRPPATRTAAGTAAGTGTTARTAVRLRQSPGRCPTRQDPAMLDRMTNTCGMGPTTTVPTSTVTTTAVTTTAVATTAVRVTAPTATIVVAAQRHTARPTPTTPTTMPAPTALLNPTALLTQTTQQIYVTLPPHGIYAPRRNAVMMH